MNKAELIAKLASKTDITQVKAGEAIDAIFHATKGVIAVELDAGRTVTLPGFGSFVTRKRAAREGRNPLTGATIQVPAKKYPAFKPGKTLKDKVAK
jgi:DNA-binding protein HU-beta